MSEMDVLGKSSSECTKQEMDLVLKYLGAKIAAYKAADRMIRTMKFAKKHLAPREYQALRADLAAMRVFSEDLLRDMDRVVPARATTR